QAPGRRQKSRWANGPDGTPVCCGPAASGRLQALLAIYSQSPEQTGYCPAGLAGVAGLGAGADVVAGGFEAGAGVAGAGAPAAVFLSYSSIISFVISMLGEAYRTGVCCELTSTTMV